MIETIEWFHHIVATSLKVRLGDRYDCAEPNSSTHQINAKQILQFHFELCSTEEVDLSLGNSTINTNESRESKDFGLSR